MKRKETRTLGYATTTRLRTEGLKLPRAPSGCRWEGIVTEYAADAYFDHGVLADVVRYRCKVEFLIVARSERRNRK